MLQDKLAGRATSLSELANGGAGALLGVCVAAQPNLAESKQGEGIVSSEDTQLNKVSCCGFTLASMHDLLTVISHGKVAVMS